MHKINFFIKLPRSRSEARREESFRSLAGKLNMKQSPLSMKLAPGGVRQAWLVPVGNERKEAIRLEGEKIKSRDCGGDLHRVRR